MPNKSYSGISIFTCIQLQQLVRFQYSGIGINPVPEIIDTFFTKTSPKRSFSMTEYERFGLFFMKTRVYKFGHSTVREKGERGCPPCTWTKETLSTNTTAFLGRNHGQLSKRKIVNIVLLIVSSVFYYLKLSLC